MSLAFEDQNHLSVHKDTLFMAMFGTLLLIDCWGWAEDDSMEGALVRRSYGHSKANLNINEEF